MTGRIYTGLNTYQLRTLDGYWYYDLTFKDVGSDRDRAATILVEPEHLETCIAKLTEGKPWVGRVIAERCR